MRLATDDIFIRHGNDAVRLRPSLRAAMRLQQKHGLGKIVAGLEEGNIGIIRDILVEADDPLKALRILDRMIQAHLGRAIDDLQEPLGKFLVFSFGIDDEDHPAETREKAGKPFSIEDALAEMFEIGTGWLAWSPAETWAATPAEIMAAQRGMIAKFKAIYGSAEEDKPAHDPREEIPDNEVRAGIAKLRAETKRGRKP